MAGRYLEDFHPGEVIELGSRTVSAEEIIAFARQFDPQYFHTDPERARESPFGGLIASGWHSAAMFMRLMVDSFVSRMAESMGSPGVDGIRWLKPVRPGDTLKGRVTVVDVIPSKSRADRGTLKSLGELLNEKGEVVMQINAAGFFARRPKSLSK
jgi:acyl dehydratase